MVPTALAQSEFMTMSVPLEMHATLKESNFHVRLCAKRMPTETFENLDILVPTILPRAVVAFIRIFMMLHVNFLSLAYLVLITIL